MQRKVVATCSALTLVGFSAWAYFEPSFEPVIGMIASFGTLAHSYWPKFNSAKVTSLHSREFGALKARWHAEKNLDSPKYDEAKYLLSLMINFLSQLRISEISDQFHGEIDQAMSCLLYTSDAADE